jgi:regulator of sigma E protease
MSFYTLPSNLFFIVVGIIGIGFLIGFHELGHFLFAKLFRIHTPSFSIGFGPRLFSKKIGGTEFKISAIPLGGYVEISGLAEPGQGKQEHAHRADTGSFKNKPYYQKLLVMFGGILFNFLFAYMALILVFMTGAPKTRLLGTLNVKPVISAIPEISPAKFAGLEVGDTIIAVNGQSIETNVAKLNELLKQFPNEMVTLTISRNNQEQEIQTGVSSLEFMGEKIGLLAVDFESYAMSSQSIINSFYYGITTTNKFIVDTFKGFKYLISSRDTRSFSGPIAIIAIMAQGAGQGIKILLILLALISVNLAILNLIPLPILDGGQIVFTTIEAIIGRDLPIKVREYIAIVSWIFILILILYLSAQDIYRIAGVYIDKIRSLFQ